MKAFLFCIIPFLALALSCAGKDESASNVPPKEDAGAASNPHLIETQISRTILNLNKVLFLDARTGWAVGKGGTILHTTDGGQNWQPQASESDENFIDIDFINPTTGWAVSSRIILRTQDGGRTWREVWDTGAVNDIVDENSPAYDKQAILIRISFANARRGWALGLGWSERETRYAIPLIFQTDDGGQSWSGETLDEEYGVVKAVNAQTCILAGKFGRVAQTTDGGQSWIKRSSLVDDDILAIGFVNEKSGWAVGSQGSIIATTDSGRTWAAQYSTPRGERPLELRSINFVNDRTGYAAGFDNRSEQANNNYIIGIMSTEDGGKSWRKQIIANMHFVINSISIVDSRSAWAAGADGQIIKFRAD